MPSREELIAQHAAGEAALRSSIAAGEAALRASKETIASIKARCAADYAEFKRELRLIVGDAAPKTEAAPEKRKRRPLTFKKRDISRAVAGHMQAGLSVQRTEIDKTGRIVIVTGQPEPVSIVPKQPENVSEWD
jgi:hypothetical protein